MHPLLAVGLALALALVAGCAQPAPVANRVQPSPEGPVTTVIDGAGTTSGGAVPRLPIGALP